MVKIICAGYPKTGTKSLTKALRILGYGKVYDHEEALQFGFEEWGRILSGESQNIDEVLDKIYSTEVEAVVDLPHSFYFEYFYRKWPDAKVILTLRDEQKGFISFKNMLETEERKHPYLRGVCQIISPMSRKLTKFYSNLFTTVWGSSKLNQLKYKMSYRRHNAYVKAVIPENNLLEYRITEGWDPLCNFLEKKVPSQDFPKLNCRGNENTISAKILQQFHVVKTINQEMFIFFALLFCTVAVFIYFALKK